MGVGTGSAAFYRYMPASIRTGQAGREIQIEEVIAERGAVRGVGRGAGTNCEDFVRARPVKCNFDLDLGVRVSLHALADGGS